MQCAHADKLPLSSGSTVSLRSVSLGLYCNSGTKHEEPAYALRCSERKPAATPGEALLVIGKNFITPGAPSESPLWGPDHHQK